jgi:putative nucleotidyltransferase with HDIG domain
MLFLGMAETMCLVPLRVGERSLGLLLFGEARSQEREPFSADKLRLARSIGEQAASALERVGLFAQLEQSYLQTVLALANAVDAKDTYTADHAQRLAQLALAVGSQLGMTDHDLEALRYGAILHDIGKIGIPDAVLQKPAPLDAAEWAQMRQHPVIGAGILAPVPQLASAAEIVRHHHERYDGKGYPDGLAGEAIPLGARILTVVDSYSAITDKRVYKAARPASEAVAELRRYAATQFDPQVVEAFLTILSRTNVVISL